MKAWRVVRHGRPSEALALEDVAEPTPGPGQARVRAATTVCNYNEVDGCYGRYLTINPPLPYTLGMEVCGVVDAVGAGAERWLGRRVTACAVSATGAHAEAALVDPAMAFDAPDALDESAAAATRREAHSADRRARRPVHRTARRTRAARSPQHDRPLRARLAQPLGFARGAAQARLPRARIQLASPPLAR